MTENGAPAPASAPARGTPLLITAALPPDVLAWADGLRREHFPADRNRMAAHATLFHGLPPSAEAEVRRALGQIVDRAAPEATLSGLMDLGEGTAVSVDSPAMEALHGELAERLHGLVQQKDARPLRLHITIQAKVSQADARALQSRLAGRVPAWRFRFQGLLLSRWQDELWRPAQLYRFRGRF